MVEEEEEEDESVRANREGISRLQSLLQQVKLSWKEAEFSCSLAEMEGEEEHMRRLLQLLTNYSHNKGLARRIAGKTPPHHHQSTTHTHTHLGLRQMCWHNFGTNRLLWE